MRVEALMESHEPGHPDMSQAPVIAGDTLLRDAGTGSVRTMDAWIEERMKREHRERDECVEAVMNALARGDLFVD